MLWLCQQEASRGSNEAVTWLCLVSSASSSTYRVKTKDLKHYVSYHWLVSAVTQQLDLCFLYCFWGLSVLLLLTYVVALKIWSCHELDPRSIFHILDFITAKFLHICIMTIAALLKFQSLISMALSYGKCLTAIQIRHILSLFEF